MQTLQQPRCGTRRLQTNGDAQCVLTSGSAHRGRPCQFKCVRCDGRGEVLVDPNNMSFLTFAPCPVCQGNN